MHCYTCEADDLKQLKDGSGAFEIGIAKWFQTIERWDVQLIICKKCFRALIATLKIEAGVMSKIKKQMPTNR